jgi:hypothetical protein
LAQRDMPLAFCYSVVPDVHILLSLWGAERIWPTHSCGKRAAWTALPNPAVPAATNSTGAVTDTELDNAD